MNWDGVAFIFTKLIGTLEKPFCFSLGFKK